MYFLHVFFPSVFSEVCFVTPFTFVDNGLWCMLGVVVSFQPLCCFEDTSTGAAGLGFLWSSSLLLFVRSPGGCRSGEIIKKQASQQGSLLDA